MFAYLEALFALAEQGTMSRAALELNVSQSAVSKRIAALEHQLGRVLVEPVGNRVELTEHGAMLLQRCRPLLRELKDALHEELVETKGVLRIAVTESILLSFGARLLYRANQRMSGVTFDLYAGRAPAVMQAVQSGERSIGLCPGLSESAPDLTAVQVTSEEMVIVPAKLKEMRLNKEKEIRCVTVHAHHEVWSFAIRGIKRRLAQTGTYLEIAQTVDTFAMAVELALAGFFHAVVTKGIALRLGVPEKKLVVFPRPGVRVPISLIARKSTLSKAVVQRFLTAVKEELPEGYRGR